jgi:hypothetical protein
LLRALDLAAALHDQIEELAAVAAGELEVAAVAAAVQQLEQLLMELARQAAEQRVGP